MPSSWPYRLLDKPNTTARLIVLLLVVVGDLLLLQTGSRSSPTAWGFGLAAVVIGLFGAVRPLGTALCQAALLLAADAYGSYAHGPAALVKYIAVLSLLELAIRRPWPRAAIGAAALTGVYTIHTFEAMPAELPSLLYRVVVTVGGPVLLGGYVRATRQAAWHAQKHAEEETRAQELRTRAARVAERTAIARELHDLVAHHVSSMVLRVGVARHVLPVADERVTEVLDDLHVTGTTALTDLRRLVTVLRDPAQVLQDDAAATLVAPDGLPAALHAVIEHGRRIGLDVEESTDPGIGHLDAVRGLAVLRLVQEGLANVAKHAGPSARARVTVGMTEAGAVRLRILDRGAAPGGDRKVLAASGPGLGLVGMRERVALLGGSMRAGPDDGGWRLSVTLPAGPVGPDAERPDAERLGGARPEHQDRNGGRP
ncbi:sensor histidine kinase [Streptomyces sp. NPDC086080]|uniref:sensor histidine kinase n=1 Tax=Streptomyces sp. NPDC086080 TaxID=3365748 RepID=UPI0037D52200